MPWFKELQRVMLSVNDSLMDEVFTKSLCNNMFSYTMYAFRQTANNAYTGDFVEYANGAIWQSVSAVAASATC